MKFSKRGAFKSNSLKSDSLNGDSLKSDSLNGDSLKSDSLNAIPLALRILQTQVENGHGVPSSGFT